MYPLNTLINIETHHHYRMILSRLRMGMPSGLAEDECWPWQWKRGAKSDDYGKIYYVDEIGRRCCVTAVRALLWSQGKCKLRGREVHSRHSCDHPWCINPGHVEAGTPKQNMADMYARGRHVGRGPGKCRVSRVYKLTDDQVLEIRAARGRGSEIARAFGVGESTVSEIRSGRRKQLVAD